MKKIIRFNDQVIFSILLDEFFTVKNARWNHFSCIYILLSDSYRFLRIFQKIQVKAYLQSKGFCLKFCKTNRNCKIFILTKMVYVCYSYCSVYCLFVGWRPFISIFRRRIWGEQITGFQSKVIWKHLHFCTWQYISSI